MIVIGIDPGVSGAIARIDTTGALPPLAVDLTKINDGAPTKKGKQASRLCGRALNAALLALVPADAGTPLVVLERVIARPVGNAAGDTAQERAGNSMQSQAVMAGSRAAILAVLDILGWHPIEVTPQKWKGAAGLLKTTKNASRELAKKLYPNAAPLFSKVKDHGKAEAMLIADYGVKNLYF